MAFLIKNMNNNEAFAYLAGLQGRGMRLDLTVLRRSLERLGNPHQAYASILVGGTNGKGSICAMTASILKEAGFKVGLYTSPHLLDVRERIRLDGEMVSPEEMAEAVRAVRRHSRDELTYFEFLTAMAFSLFARHGIHTAVLEVGMGGRLDATNVVDPLVSVISNISLEHCAYLGKRLSEIAFEKAGIIREGGTCLTGAAQTSVLNALKEVCRGRQAALHRLGRDIRVRAHARRGQFSYHGMKKSYDHLPCPLLGHHQIRNAALAVGVTEVLEAGGIVVGEEQLRRGLSKAQWAGRMEVWPGPPPVVLDGAHNPAGMAVLARALVENFSFRRMIVVFGVLEDKNYRAMLQKIGRLASVLVLTRPPEARSRAPEDLVMPAKALCSRVLLEHDPARAIEMAVAQAAPGDLVCVAGSLYLVGQAKAVLGPTVRDENDHE
jgi:dihydrofolate synthase/folylpolyglutamate synthase